MFWRRKERKPEEDEQILDELRHIRAYLSLIAEVMQDRPPSFTEVQMRQFQKTARGLDEFTELACRWLFLQLPEESRGDLTAEQRR